MQYSQPEIKWSSWPINPLDNLVLYLGSLPCLMMKSGKNVHLFLNPCNLHPDLEEIKLFLCCSELAGPILDLKSNVLKHRAKIWKVCNCPHTLGLDCVSSSVWCIVIKVYSNIHSLQYTNTVDFGEHPTFPVLPSAAFHFWVVVKWGAAVRTDVLPPDVSEKIALLI